MMWNKTRLALLTISIQHRIRSPSQSITQEKQIKGIQIKEEKIKLSLLEDDLILYQYVKKS